MFRMNAIFSTLMTHLDGCRLRDLEEVAKISGVLIITHREDVASQCHRSYLMCRGHIILEGSAEAVKRYFLSQCEPCGDNAPEMSGEVAKRV